MKLFIFIVAFLFLPGAVWGFHADFNQPGDTDYDGFSKLKRLAITPTPQIPIPTRTATKTGTKSLMGTIL